MQNGERFWTHSQENKMWFLTEKTMAHYTIARSSMAFVRETTGPESIQCCRIE